MRRQRLIQTLLVVTVTVYVFQVLSVFIWKSNFSQCPFRLGRCNHPKIFDADRDQPVTISTLWRNLNQKREDLKESLIQAAENERGIPIQTKMWDGSSKFLLDQMGSDWHWAWIKKRVQSKMEEFKSAHSNVTSQFPQMKAWKKRQILILPGILTITNFARLGNLERGSPLGELVQWADLILGLHTLGHQVTLQYDLRQANVELRTEIDDELGEAEEGCHVSSYDVIFTDIGGFRSLWSDASKVLMKKFRILDAFGTEPAFNDEVYAQSHNLAINHWGMLGLPSTSQFMTFYPHTPDNSFLGFTISQLKPNLNKKDTALIMGKDGRYFRGRADLLNILMRHFEIHVTVPHEQAYNIPYGVVNHGILNPQQYKEISSVAKVLVGLGDPIESPSPLECIAIGCIFLNPVKKDEEQNQLRGKPTSRKISSQNDYLKHLGPPHVFTLDYSNLTAVEEVLRTIKKTTAEPFLPYEFSSEGFLQRLGYFMQHKQFCHQTELQSQWPPPQSLMVIKAEKETSCSDACFSRGLVCDPQLFSLINDPSSLKKNGINCEQHDVEREIHAPFIHHGKCTLQPPQDAIFSCAGFANTGMRVCACRKHLPYQSAICPQCLV